MNHIAKALVAGALSAAFAYQSAEQAGGGLTGGVVAGLMAGIATGLTVWGVPNAKVAEVEADVKAAIPSVTAVK